MKNNTEIRIAGFGGQGILLSGKLLAHAAMEEGHEVAWVPSYGPEMRGGTANCSVNLSSARICTPLVDHPNVLVVMNQPSLEAFEKARQPKELVWLDGGHYDPYEVNHDTASDAAIDFLKRHL